MILSFSDSKTLGATETTCACGMLFSSLFLVIRGIKSRYVKSSFAEKHSFAFPPYTTEMHPIERIWKEIRKMGFLNEVFATLNKVIDRLCETIQRLHPSTIHSITARFWIVSCFNWSLV